MSDGEKPPKYMTESELRAWRDRALAGEVRLGYAMAILEEFQNRGLS